MIKFIRSIVAYRKKNIFESLIKHWAKHSESNHGLPRHNNSYDKYSIANFINTFAIFFFVRSPVRLRMTNAYRVHVYIYISWNRCHILREITRLLLDVVTFRRSATSEIDVPVKASRFRQKSNPKDCCVHQLTASFQLVTD